MIITKCEKAQLMEYYTQITAGKNKFEKQISKEISKDNSFISVFNQKIDKCEKMALTNIRDKKRLDCHKDLPARNICVLIKK